MVVSEKLRDLVAIDRTNQYFSVGRQGLPDLGNSRKEITRMPAKNDEQSGRLNRSTEAYSPPRLIRVGKTAELLRAQDEGGFTDSINRHRKAQAATKSAKAKKKAQKKKKK